MRNIQELEALKANLEKHQAYITADKYILGEALALVDQAISQQRTIKEWYRFMSIMAQRSSWASHIKRLLNLYMYGVEDAETIKAAKRYLKIAHSLDIDT